LPTCFSCHLLPSEYESFGLAALEAMAAGVPVIASNAGGLPEIIQQGKTGYLAPVGDIETMAKDALSVISDGKTLQQFKANAAAHALNYDISKVVPQYEKLYGRFL
jgi:L-malate glycosyltransferase